MSLEEVEGEGKEEDAVVTMASLIVSLKLHENIIEDLAERLCTVQELSELALDLDDEPNSFRFVIAAIHRICNHPLTKAFKDQHDSE